MKRGVFLASLVLIGCSNVDEAQDAVAYNMIDPESAQFREVEERETGTVCGQVNAKNRMGAYVDYTPFYAESSGDDWDVTMVDDDDYYGLEEWKENCVDGYAAFKNIMEASESERDNE